MILLYCPDCRDMLKVSKTELRSCYCGNSSGRYDVDGSSIVLFGEAISIRISESSLSKAITHRIIKGKEKKFNAYVTATGYKGIKLKSNDKLL